METARDHHKPDLSEALLADVARHAIADGVDRLLRSERSFQSAEGDTAEAVHQTRVATRRLRSDMRTFGSALDDEWAAALREELNWLAALLGAARDADVLWQRIAMRVKRLDPSAAEGAVEILSTLAEQRSQAHRELAQALAGARHDILLRRLTDAARAPLMSASQQSGRRSSEELPRLVRRRWRALERRVRSLPGHASDGDLHQVRLCAKRCRYAAEACSPWLGGPAVQLARAAKSVQEVLGDLNDAVVAERWLHECEGQAASPLAASAARKLAKLERADAARQRLRWRKTWTRAAAQASALGPHMCSQARA